MERDGRHTLQQLFPLSEVIEDEESYTSLHKIVLGLLHIDLASSLRKPTVRASIDTPTWTGISALGLAVRRRDVGAARLLLEAGADPNLPKTGLRNTPMHFSIDTGDVEMVRLLLRYGADVNAAGRHGLCPIHNIRMVKNEDAQREILSLLLDHGADICARTVNGCEPLSGVAKEGSVASLGFLLDHGADIDHRDNDGDVALFESVTPRSTRRPDCSSNAGRTTPSSTAAARPFSTYWVAVGMWKCFGSFLDIK
jgi:ankyrin repeat protein